MQIMINYAKEDDLIEELHKLYIPKEHNSFSSVCMVEVLIDFINNTENNKNIEIDILVKDFCRSYFKDDFDNLRDYEIKSIYDITNAYIFLIRIIKL